MAYEFNHYYEIQNVATGKYVNVLGNHEDGTVKNGETVNLFNRTNNPDQRWALENFGGNGNVRIVLQRGEGWYALNYNTRNTNCIVWHLNTADDTDTVITTVEVENRPNTYYLMLRDRSIYLTAVGTALKWSAYTGEEEQMFTILEPGTGSDGSESGEVFFDDSYTASLENEAYGKVSIVYSDKLDSYKIHADFKRLGTTKLILRSPEGKDTMYNLTIKKDTYELTPVE